MRDSRPNTSVRDLRVQLDVSMSVLAAFYLWIAVMMNLAYNSSNWGHGFVWQFRRPEMLAWVLLPSAMVSLMPLAARRRWAAITALAMVTLNWVVVSGILTYLTVLGTGIAMWWRPRELILIGWLIGLTVLHRQLVRQIRWIDANPPRVEGICHRCLYNLTGNQSGTCPECGTAVPAKI